MYANCKCNCSRLKNISTKKKFDFRTHHFRTDNKFVTKHYKRDTICDLLLLGVIIRIETK